MLRLARFIGERRAVEVVLYATEEPGFRSLDAAMCAEAVDSDSIFVFTTAVDVPDLLTRLGPRRSVYYAFESGWPLDLPVWLPILSLSRGGLTRLSERHPGNAIFHLPPALEPEVVDRGGERDIDILHLGRKSSPYLREELLPALAPRCRLEVVDRFVSRAELLAYFNRSRVYLYDSSSSFADGIVEGFGLQPLEALACGCAVVSNLAGGLGDFLDPGINCERLRYVLADDLARCLAALAEPPSSSQSAVLRDAYSEAAIRTRLDRILPLVEGLAAPTAAGQEREVERHTTAARAAADAPLYAGIRRRDSIIADLQSELAATVAQRDGTIRSLQDELHRKVATCNAVISELKVEIETRDGIVDRLQTEVRQLTDHLTQREGHILDLGVQTRDLAARLEQTEGDLGAIHSSRLWRLAGAYWRALDVVTSIRSRLRRLAAPRLRPRRGSSRAPADGPPAPPCVAPPQLRRRLPIVVFPIIDWEFRFQRPQHLASRLAARGHEIFYLSVRFTGEQSGRCDSGPLGPGVTRVTLPGLANTVIYRDDIAPSLATKLAALEAFLAAQDVTEALLLVQFPFWAPLAAALADGHGWKLVYDCMDDHAGFGTHGPTTLTRELELRARADLVVVSSRALEKSVAGQARNMALIPNAGDFARFSALPRRDTSPLAALPRPVIGYYGAIAEWFDSEALRLAVNHRPQWSFALVGHTFGADLDGIAGKANVTLTGEVPYAELPAMLAAFDVCTIPFRLLPLTEATNPVKVFEYLAAGRPVVARRLPELEPLATVVDLYESPAGFVAALERAVADGGVGTPALRAEFAAANTWEHRAAAFSAAIAGIYPEVVVVVVSYNGLDHTRRCLDSLFTATEWPNFRVIVVDNGSGPEVEAYLTAYAAREPRLAVVFNRANLGFAAANNVAFAHLGTAAFVVLLNNDTVVPPGWLTRLLRWASQPAFGLVGPVTNWAGNEARVEVDYRDLAEMPAYAARRAAARRGTCFDIDVLAMFCVAMRREVFDRVGPLDERFGIGMFEDDDYAKRVRQAGWRVVCVEDTFVHHHGRAAFERVETAEYRALFERNRRLFEEKWGEPWVPHVYRPR